jgi:hypothetical protein
MANEIVFQSGKPSGYVNYTVATFSNWRALEDAAKFIRTTKPNTQVDRARESYKGFVENVLSNPSNPKISSYGMFGKHPKSYKEAMERSTYIYYDEYTKIKKKVERAVSENLKKSSTVEAMKPRLVFNDKQIGEFVFDRAAMALQPEIFVYSFVYKKVINFLEDKIKYEGKRMFLVEQGKKKDQEKLTEVFYTLKVEKPDGTEEYVVIKGEETLAKASEMGIVSCTSSNKKVYLHKEKKPKIFNGVKIIVGLTAGGFTSWTNDFYTGITAAIVTEVLEGLGYTVDVEVAVGGGRCGGCDRRLNFPNVNFKGKGRRLFTFTAKSFDDQLDIDGLLYTLSDPSFHNIKWISLLNDFFNFFDDEIDTADGSSTASRYSGNSGNPAGTWHGIEDSDMTNPIGMYHLAMDIKKGNTNLMHFYIHRVKDEADVVAQITDLVLTCENRNLEALKLYSEHDFGLDN